MPRHIAIIQGHPDQSSLRFCRALAAAYGAAAQKAGHAVEVIDVAALDFPLLRTKSDFDSEAPPPAIREAQEIIKRADHLVVVFPLWLGDMPALLKGFFEQLFRPDFAYSTAPEGRLPKALLTGKSAHVFVTMGMPVFFYRFYFGAHGVKNLRRNILRFCGVKPVHETLIGNIQEPGMRAKEEWLTLARRFGREGV